MLYVTCVKFMMLLFDVKVRFSPTSRSSALTLLTHNCFSWQIMVGTASIAGGVFCSIVKFIVPLPVAPLASVAVIRMR